jgi:ribonucleoside-diphosphate reductase alpha chain
VSRVDFVDQLGDKWQEYKVYHHGFKKWMDATGKTDEQIAESPYWKATSNDVDWTMSVKLQAAAQKWVCHAISKTCNLPNDVTREVVADVYMTAWEAGCKGFTVYRDGCRTGVLVQDTPKEEKKTVDDQPETMVENHAPKRPKELPCDIHRINVKGSEGQESYLVLVGKLDDKPYEIFCGLSSHVEVPKKAKVGTLIKNGKKDGVATYNLQIPVGDDDQLAFKDIVELFSNPRHGAFTRTLSLSLRHGVPVQYIVEQLQKDKYSDMQSFSRVLARVLKGYIPDGAKSTSDKVCPECTSSSLVYKEGCVTCSSCGWSRC